jgi:alkylhydroperoxidase family enzyme
METGDFSVLEPQERAVVTFVSEIVEHVTPSDATLAAIRAYYSDAQVFEVIMLVGSYMTTARIIGTCGFGIEEPA